MERTINNQSCQFIPLRKFQETWNLPDTFSIDYFESTDWSGLGSLDRAGQTLAQIKKDVAGKVPETIAFTDLLAQADALVIVFEHAMKAANPQIGLPQVEIDLVITDFSDIIHAVVYELVRAAHTSQQAIEAFDFKAVYRHWLDTSTRVGSATQTYTHNNTAFTVRIVYDAYGRLGLEIEVEDNIHYIADTSSARPAANFMEGLSAEVSQAFYQAFLSGF